MSALKAVGFCDLTPAIPDDSKNCISICKWRHSRTDSHPPKSIIIPKTKALELIMSTVQGFGPNHTYSDNMEILNTMRNKLKEDEHGFVTRYDLDYEAKVTGKIPTDSEDVELQTCNIFHLTLKAAVQCKELKPIDRPTWPGDVDGDFRKRSELCKNIDALFYSKADEWLNIHSTRR